jgi:hypothetical protein
VLVSDDADPFKTAADTNGLTHQVCKTHVGRNTEAWVESMAPILAADADGSLAAIHNRYVGAAPPAKGGTMSPAYRLRLCSLDRGNLWPRLTRYRSWEGPNGETLDGTNNACERAIGWWVKERYRSMRAYQRPASVLNVSRLIAAMGNALDGPGFALAEVIV